MTAHVLYPALDPDHPATLSRSIITHLLRRELGYEGVVFSDDLEMKAISENRSVEDAISLAINAGVDVLLFCHREDLAVQTFEVLCQAAERRSFMRERVEESCKRIRGLKARRLKPFTPLSENELKQQIGWAEHLKISQEIEKLSK
jgi:beta-N-acetylhexosaminidase